METRIWLHAGHGLEVANLQPLPAQRRDGTLVAEALEADASSSPGVAIELRVPERELRSTENGSHVFTIPLLFADISCVRAPGGSDAGENLLIAIVPPVVAKEAASTGGFAGRGLGGTREGAAMAWFVVAAEADQRGEMLDALSLAGGVRSDLEEAYDRTEAADPSHVVGQGAYATVLRMKDRTGTAVAVKAMHPEMDVEAIEREVSALLEVHQHEHIVGFRGIFYDQNSITLRLSVVFDLAPGGDLLHRVLKADGVSEDTAKPWLSGMLAALIHIHNRDIVHRDVKAENVLLLRDDFPVLADFGLAARLNDSAQMGRRCGSPGYVAPEVCLGQPYDTKVDVFGAGVVLYFMLSKEMPFSSPDHDIAATMRKTVKCTLHLRRAPWDKLTSALRKMLRSLICKEQDERLTSVAALQHEWLQPPARSPPGSAEEASAAAAAAAAPSGEAAAAPASVPLVLPAGAHTGGIVGLGPCGPPGPVSELPARPPFPSTSGYPNGPLGQPVPSYPGGTRDTYKFN